nr:ATP synthase protein 8 [Ambassis interrupta]
MPQLNPSPWFLIMIFSWLVFLVFIPPKVMSHVTPNQPTHQNVQKPQVGPWTWLWH